jgi:hypothetical protein
MISICGNHEHQFSLELSWLGPDAACHNRATVAIVLNTAVLALVPLATAHGGLLRLLVILTGGAISPTGAVFQTGFHVAVGLAMAVFYAFTLEPYLRGPSWLRRLLYALAVWLANAAIVLPATGEGFAGSRHLTLAGMVWFAAGHTLFLVVQAVLYSRLRERQSIADPSLSTSLDRASRVAPTRSR